LEIISILKSNAKDCYDDASAKQEKRKEWDKE
jgi:hypothetical protein